MLHEVPINQQPSTINCSIAILATASQKAELLGSPLFRPHSLLFAEDFPGLVQLRADAYMDLLFEPDPERIERLSGLLPAPVFINSVIQTLSSLHPGFIRLNAWPGYLGASLLEAAADTASQGKARQLFGDLILFVKDVPGLVNPRIISMIINEAYHTLDAGTSSREEIDTAMKLGTGYPLGPFEWAEKIGRSRVVALLDAMEVECAEGLVGG
jgi:3-hydroxybutyryl-CoA dehydrogenase